jgi:5-formyltetrahydrofolate cyclo-ligase
MTFALRQKSIAREKYAQLRQEARTLSNQEMWGPRQKRLFLEWWAALCPGFNGLYCSYFPIKDELNLLPAQGEGTWCFPMINGSHLHWFPWGAEEPVPEKGKFGIPAQASGLPPEAIFTRPTIFFTPALAVNSEGFRLGYGGGYYDRLFANPQLRARSVIVIAIPECCSQADFPVEDHDIRCDIIVTEHKITEITPGVQLLSRLETDKT